MMAKLFTNILAAKLAFVFGSVLIFSFMFFAIVYPKKERIPRIFGLLIIPTLVFSILSFFDGVLFRGVKVVNNTLMADRGSAYLFFVAYVVIYFASSTVILFRRHQKATGDGKLRFKYFVAGLFFFALPTLFSNVVLPVFGIYDFNTIGPLFSVIFVVLTAYSILRYRLMDIRIVLRESFVYTAAAATLIGLGLMLMYVENQYLKSVLSPSLAGALILFLGIMLFGPLKNNYVKVANKYFFAGLYNYEKTVKKLTETLTSSLDFTGIINSMLETLRNEVKVEKVAVIIFNRSRGSEKAHYKKFEGFNRKEEKEIIEEFVLKGYQEKVKKENLTKEIFIEKVKQNFETIRTLFNVEICLFLFGKERLAGVVFLGCRENDSAYTKEDIELLETMSKQASVALENALLYEEIEGFSEKLRGEVKRQTKEISMKNEELEKNMIEKTVFTELLNHQIRTPLAVLKNYLSYWENGKYKNFDETKQKKYQRNILDSAKKLDIISKDLLMFLKSENSVSKENFQKVDFSKLISEVFTDYEKGFARRNLRLAGEIQENLIVLGDQVLLREALRNLVDNASKYASSNSVIYRSLLAENGRIIFRISNQTDEIFQNHVDFFSKFKRGKKAKEMNPEGTGMGIYIVRKIVEKIGGMFFLNVKKSRLEIRFEI